jgi:hypothetical protein
LIGSAAACRICQPANQADDNIRRNTPSAILTYANWLFLAVTGFIAWHAIRFRDEHGDPDPVRLLFGCIAAVFFFKVLFEGVLGVMRF